MSSVIKIKKSSGNLAPPALGSGELAYSWDEAGGFAGGKLWIGAGSESGGEAANIFTIGGKYFTDMLDHVPGVTQALSALILDANKKIDNLKVDNLDIDGNTIASTDLNGNINITPSGTGKTVIGNIYVGDAATSLQSYIQSVSSGVVAAGEGIDVSVVGSVVTVSAEDATDTNKGIASFNATDFSVSSGAVSLQVERIQDIVGAMVSGNTESGIVITYDDALGVLNFDVNDPTITISGDVDGSATMTNLGNVTINVTLDTVNTNVGTFGSATQIPVVTVNGKGLVTGVSTATVATTLNIAGGTGAGTVSLLSQTLSILAGSGLTTSAANQAITVSAVDASTTIKGVASYNTNHFTVTSGAVSAKTATIGSTTVELGNTTTALAGLQSLGVDNINIDGNIISSTNANGDIVLDPNGTGAINVSGARITNVAEPVNDSDVATKYYVDAARSGLDVKGSVRVATTANITLRDMQIIDGVAVAAGDRVLVKDQTTGSQNGIYVVAASDWTRATDADSSAEVNPGMFVFVEEGTTNQDTGFVLTNNGTITLGTTALNFTLFSSSGTLIAGNGLTKNGYTLEVVTAANGGLEISSDALQLKSTVAGAGLTYSAGVLAVGGTANRIIVNADSIDIASTYVGQTSITTLGTITTGTWNAGVVGVQYGGTGLSTLTSRGVLFGNGTSAVGIVAVSATDGSFLREDSTGNPYWSNVIDGGTY